MNILYVVDVDIENPSFGNAQRTRLVYDALCKIGKVYVLNTKKLRLCPQKGFKRIVNAIWQRIVINPCGRCLVPVYPFPLRWSIEEWFPNVNFDVVVARYLYYVGSMSLWKISRRLYVDIDDYPMQVLKTVFAPNYGFLRKIVSRLVNDLFCKFVIGKLTGCWIANPDQVRLVSTRVPCIPLLNIPFSVTSSDENERQYIVHNREEYVFTVGLMSYAPNYLGVDSFLREVWPVVHSKYPDLRYKIVGRGVPAQYSEEWAKLPNVEILGYVDELSDLYAKCIATVVPISSGGGTCIKTLEAMLNSRICISSPFGTRGLPEAVWRDGANGVVVYRSPQDFTDVIDRIKNDERWREQSEQAAAKYIRTHYSRENFEKTVLKLIESKDAECGHSSP